MLSYKKLPLSQVKTCIRNNQRLISLLVNPKPSSKNRISIKKMPTLTKLFNVQETVQHNSQDDCWVVIDGKVYDVSSYMDKHPGGDDVFLNAKGKDAKEEFEDAGHSQDARDLMEKFCIGELDLSASTIPELEISSQKQNQADIVQKIKDLPTQYWAVPGAVGIAVIVGFLYLRK